MTAEKDKMQRILDKLRKLMDLKESATVCGEVGEANAAAAGIARLLKEYDLTLQDIPSGLKPADPVGEEKLDFTPPYMQYPWYWDLCETVARHNGTTVLRTRTFGGGRKLKSVSYTLVGRSRNRQVTAYLISFLCHQFIHIGRQGYPDWKWQQQADSAEEVLHVLQDVTGLGKAVEAMNNARTEGEIIDHAFTVLMRHMLFDPGYRAMMLEKLDAEEAHTSRALIHNVKDGCRAFNRTHEAQIFFTQEEEADNQWVLTWEDPV